MANIYSQVEGTTFGAHDEFLKKLTEKGAKTVSSLDGSDATILFCPIVSRYETDLNSALSKLQPDVEIKKLILVAMHHTRDPDYTTPSYSELSRAVDLKVDCLFHEQKGLLECSKNETAVKSVRQELDPKHSERRPQQPNCYGMCVLF